jgi:hypothetical protein
MRDLYGRLALYGGVGQWLINLHPVRVAPRQSCAAQFTLERAATKGLSKTSIHWIAQSLGFRPAYFPAVC